MIGGAVLLVAALAVGAGYAAMNADDATSPPRGAGTTTTSSGSTPSSGSSASTTAGSASDTSSSSTSPGGTASASVPDPSSSTTSSTSPDAAALAALASCTALVRAQQGLATAVAASARDWELHTDAQRKFDSGAFTEAQTTAQWAASKARGPADLAANTRAVKAVNRARGGCDRLAAATAGSSVERPGRRCATRSAALARVARTGAVVNRQWAAHLAMMAHKEQMGAAEYLDRWSAMVADAKPALTAYRAAAAGLAQAPPCSA